MDDTVKKMNDKTIALNEELSKRTKILEGKVENQIQTTKDLFRYFISF